MVFRTLPSPFGTSKSASASYWANKQVNSAYTSTSPFLKERLFGLSNPQGNHGESLKEAHFHLDNTPVRLQWPRV